LSKKIGVTINLINIVLSNYSQMKKNVKMAGEIKGIRGMVSQSAIRFFIKVRQDKKANNSFRCMAAASVIHASILYNIK